MNKNKLFSHHATPQKTPKIKNQKPKKKQTNRKGWTQTQNSKTRLFPTCVWLDRTSTCAAVNRSAIKWSQDRQRDNKHLPSLHLNHSAYLHHVHVLANSQAIYPDIDILYIAVVMKKYKRLLYVHIDQGTFINRNNEVLRQKQAKLFLLH